MEGGGNDAVREETSQGGEENTNVNHDSETCSPSSVGKE